MEFNEELLAVLEPFVEATTVMSGSQYPTVSMLSPLLYKLLKVTLSHKDENNPAIKCVKDAIANDLNVRYTSRETTLMLSMSAFLDPRFKDLNLFVDEDDKIDVLEEVKLELLNLVKRSDYDNGSTQSRNETQDEIEEPAKKKSKIFSLFGDLTESRSKSDLSEIELVNTKLLQYERESMLDLVSNPLQWWKLHERQYPTLSKLVKKLWSMTATSVRSENIFLYRR